MKSKEGPAQPGYKPFSGCSVGELGVCEELVVQVRESCLHRGGLCSPGFLLDILLELVAWVHSEVLKGTS